MDTRKVPLSQGSSYGDDYGFPSDEELAGLADELFVMYDNEEQQDGRSKTVTEKP